MARARKTPHVPVTPEVDRFEEAVHAFQRRLPVTPDAWAEMTAEERRRAFTVAGVAQADLVTDVWEAIDRAIRDGTTLEDFKADVGEMLESQWGGDDPSRLETIFRTNVQSAYMEGRYEVFSAPAVKEARPNFRFEIIDDDRVDDECADLEDVILPQDDSFWNTRTPPLHFNCRCSLTALSDDEADEEGRTTDPPDVEHAADGFGARPDVEGKGWSPDLDGYPAAIADELARKLR